MNNKLFHVLERECLIYLSQKEVTQEQFRPLINEFLSTQPEHPLLIVAARFQKRLGSQSAHEIDPN